MPPKKFYCLFSVLLVSRNCYFIFIVIGFLFSHRHPYHRHHDIELIQRQFIMMFVEQTVGV